MVQYGSAQKLMWIIINATHTCTRVCTFLEIMSCFLCDQYNYRYILKVGQSSSRTYDSFVLCQCDPPAIDISYYLDVFNRLFGTSHNAAVYICTLYCLCV